MLFELAARLKVWNPDALALQMPRRLFVEWIAYLGVKSEVERDAIDRKE